VKRDRKLAKFWLAPGYGSGMAWSSRESRSRVAVNLEQNAMLQPLPIMIGFALWFIFVIAWNVTARPATTIATPGARRERLYGLVIALGLTMIVVAPFLLVRRGFQIWINPPLLAWGMLLVVAAGIALCWWAKLHLRSLWSDTVTRKEGHRVVDSGPYRLVRHPIYTGFIVIDLGLAILCGSALALVGVAVITVGLWLKARVEEQFLSEELGAAAYGAYKARTPMLVPRIPRRPDAD
jgi:protein-S-isoprenylcysteine O-methyltransferase Ste14